MLVSNIGVPLRAGATDDSDVPRNEAFRDKAFRTEVIRNGVFRKVGTFTVALREGVTGSWAGGDEAAADNSEGAPLPSLVPLSGSFVGRKVPLAPLLSSSMLVLLSCTV